MLFNDTADGQDYAPSLIDERMNLVYQWNDTHGENGHIWRKICPRPTFLHPNSTWICLWVQTQASATVELYQWENLASLEKGLCAILSRADSTWILLGSNPGLHIEGSLNTHVSCHVAA